MCTICVLLLIGVVICIGVVIWIARDDRTYDDLSKEVQEIAMDSPTVFTPVQDLIPKAPQYPALIPEESNGRHYYRIGATNYIVRRQQATSLWECLDSRDMNPGIHGVQDQDTCEKAYYHYLESVGLLNDETSGK
jgi:hypothetical protein